MKLILKLSGEALKGKREMGIEPEEINKLAKQVKTISDSGYQVGIILGGGNFFRGRDASQMGLDREDCDYMGMMGTIMNSIAFLNSLRQIGCDATIYSSLPIPSVLETYDKDKANKDLEANKVVILAGGTGKPYCSTDSATLLKARDLGSKLILMGKNGVDGVYNKDPNVACDAIKYDIITHKEIQDKRLEVMDLEASNIAHKENIDIILFDIDAKNSIIKAAKREKIGTLITKEK